MAEGRIPVGLQLYSIRGVIDADVPGSLKQLADMGYEGVEFAGTYGLAADELRSMLDAAGLKAAGAHVGIPDLEGDALAQTVETYKTLGTNRLIIPGADLDQLDETIRRINAVLPGLTALGACTGFHNHTAEFDVVDGMTKYDKIFAETPEEFLVQLDIGWATAAGQDIPALLTKYANRLPTVHIKEFNPDDDTAVVGEGSVDWPTVMTQLESETVVEWYIVEQEQYAVGPMESVKGCIDNIRKMGR
jgi:sugar phosphate isomerase/epimerase